MVRLGAMNSCLVRPLARAVPVAASHDDDLAPQPGQQPPGRGEDDAAQVPVRCHRRGRANRVRARDGGQEDAWLDGKPSRRWKRAGLERYRHRARVRRFLHLRGRQGEHRSEHRRERQGELRDDVRERCAPRRCYPAEHDFHPLSESLFCQTSRAHTTDPYRALPSTADEFEVAFRVPRDPARCAEAAVGAPSRKPLADVTAKYVTPAVRTTPGHGKISPRQQQPTRVLPPAPFFSPFENQKPMSGARVKTRGSHRKTLPIADQNHEPTHTGTSLSGQGCDHG